MEVRALCVGEIGTNCYLLCDEKVCAVIDPGGEADRVKLAIEESGCTPVAILLTHGHYDHTSAVAALHEIYPDAQIWISAKEPLGTGRLFPALPEGVRNYDEGDTVTVGSLAVSVLATPGHSKGSVCLLCESVLFSGDTLFQASCGRTDLRGGDWEEMLASLRRLAQLPGNYTVCPGHMDTSELDIERSTNPYLLQALQNDLQ